MAKYTLKELSVSKLEYGSGAAACEFDGNVRYVRITDITDEGKLADDIVSPSYFEEKHILHDGDILFARTGATVGKTFLYRETYGKCVYAGFLIRMIPDTNKVLPDYIYYFTKSPRYHNFVAMSMKVVAQPNINAKQYGDLVIDIPSFSEQESVVRRLTKLDVLIALRKEQLAKLDELVKARFVEIFGAGNYPYEELIDLIIEGAGLSYGIVQPGDDGTGDMGVLRPVDMVDGKISMGSIKYIDRSIGDGFKKTELTGEELLITVRGTTGITALTDTRFAGMNVTRGIAVIRYDPNKINPVYLNAYLNTDESQRYIKEHTRGATLRQINLSDLRMQQIMVPPMEVQNQVAAFIEETNKTKLTIQASLDKLEVMKKALMQEYFG